MFDSIACYILSLKQCLVYWFKKYMDEASFRCKVCTGVAFILFLIFGVINLCQMILDSQAQEMIGQTADLVFDSKITQIDEMNATDQETFQPIRYLLVNLKTTFISTATIASSIVIGIYTDFFKLPFEMVRKLLQKILENINDEIWTWIPCYFLGVIDLIELVMCFT